MGEPAQTRDYRELKSMKHDRRQPFAYFSKLWCHLATYCIMRSMNLYVG